MSFTEITFDDRMRLEQLQNERLRSFFAQSLLDCMLRRTCCNTLIIDCPETWIVDVLQSDLEELGNYAWLILGADATALYYVQEEICRIEHHRVYPAL